MNERENTRGFNKTYHVTYRSGIIGLVMGERLSKSMDRALQKVSDDRRRVVFLVKDEWSIWQRIGAALMMVCTLFMVGRSVGQLLITEPMSQEQREWQEREENTLPETVTVPQRDPDRAEPAKA